MALRAPTTPACRSPSAWPRRTEVRHERPPGRAEAEGRTSIRTDFGCRSRVPLHPLAGPLRRPCAERVDALDAHCKIAVGPPPQAARISSLVAPGVAKVPRAAPPTPQ